MTKFYKYIILLLSLVAIATAAYPEKPVTFIVHSKPGSAIDITTRQLIKIAAKYSDATFLVENKTGGSGIIAMRDVLSKKANGYTVLAVTKSFISTVLMTGGSVNMSDFHFLACLVIDPEVLITNRNANVRTLDQIIADAKEKQGHQKWLGPLVGGVDHLMAVKTWHKLGIKGEWIPFEGGSDALASLMGQHGVVYVGNPVDVKGRPNLMIAAIAARDRLTQFPETPTFLEKGYDIADEVLWRGYALKKGTNPAAVTFLDSLFRKISRDKDWLTYVNNTSAKPVYLDHKAFTKMVNGDKAEAVKYLKLAGVLKNVRQKNSASKTGTTLSIALVFLIILLILYFFKRPWFRAEVVIGLLLIFLSGYLYWLTLDFPQGELSKTAGPAAMPRLWLYGLVLFSAILIVNTIRDKAASNIDNGRNRIQSMSLIGLMIAYLLIVGYLGYYISTTIFLISGAYLLGYRKHWIIAVSGLGFTLLSYLIFYKLLQVPLPLGIFE